MIDENLASCVTFNPLYRAPHGHDYIVSSQVVTGLLPLPHSKQSVSHIANHEVKYNSANQGCVPCPQSESGKKIKKNFQYKLINDIAPLSRHSSHYIIIPMEPNWNWLHLKAHIHIYICWKLQEHTQKPLTNLLSDVWTRGIMIQVPVLPVMLRKN